MGSLMCFVSCVYIFALFGWQRCTPEFLSKKHLNFGQGLEFLKFGQGNRGPNQQNGRSTKEKKEKPRKITCFERSPPSKNTKMQKYKMQNCKNTNITNTKYIQGVAFR